METHSIGSTFPPPFAAFVKNLIELDEIGMTFHELVAGLDAGSGFTDADDPGAAAGARRASDQHAVNRFHSSSPYFWKNTCIFMPLCRV